MTIHAVKIGNHTEKWDTKNDPKLFLKSVCPKGREGDKWWYSEYDQKGNLVEQGQNIGKHAA